MIVGYPFANALVAVALAAAVSSFGTEAGGAERPNIVWIVSEDNSIHYLRHFFEEGAKAPNIEALAAHGLTFDHAFSNAPVCSVARTTLMTSCYAPRIGTQYHRRYRMMETPGVRMFPYYLRAEGYYTTNNSKKDYNAVEGEGVWDESSRKASWRNRPEESTPFFHMESHGQSHESSLHFSREHFETNETEHDPARVKLAPYHPNTPMFRYTHARYLDRMQVIDGIVGQTVAKLKEDGLLEDTFIFYFGDHGGVLPRSKGYIYESGLHVPLVVRVPDSFRHLVDAEHGTRVKGFVSFVDFGPTVHQLVGVNRRPESIDGRPFLGAGITSSEVNGRDEAFGYADRFDEKYDMIRSLRKGRFQYIRNYQSWLPDGLNNNYRYKNLAYAEWRDLFESEELEGTPKQFFESKPVEMLFDCEADPHQVVNLAGDPAHAETLAGLRARLRTIVKEMPDTSFYPESYYLGRIVQEGARLGKGEKGDIEELVDTADLALLPLSEARPKIKAALKSPNSMVRYWGAMVCTAFGAGAVELADEVQPLLSDEVEIVRVRAAEFLGRIGKINPQPVLTEIVNTTRDPVVATEALNSVAWFRDFFEGRYPVRRSDFRPAAKGADVEDRLNYIDGVPYPPKAPKRKKTRKGASGNS